MYERKLKELPVNFNGFFLHLSAAFWKSYVKLFLLCQILMRKM